MSVINDPINIKEGTVFLGNIPYRLDPKEFQQTGGPKLKGYPELYCFPLNILFSNDCIRNQKHVFGRAMYEPDLDTFKEDGETRSMIYYNILTRDWRVEITYFKKKDSYIGLKFNKDKMIVNAVGKEWRMFFFYLTMRGPNEGEMCTFEEIE
jgi:hypothetical protein